MSGTIKLSVVLPLYNNSSHVYDLIIRLSNVFNQLNSRVNYFEIVFVDDCYGDNVLDQIEKIIFNDTSLHYVEFQLIQLAQNVGQHQAILAGLRQTTGDYVVVMDSDLEENPDEIPRFWEEMQRLNCEAVHGFTERRENRTFAAMAGSLFHSINKILYGVVLINAGVTFKLISRRFSQVLIEKSQTKFSSLNQACAEINVPQSFLKIKKRVRNGSSYTLLSRFKMAQDMILSGMDVFIPISVASSLIVCFSSFIVGGLLVLSTIFGFNFLSGWASTILSVIFFGSFNLFLLSVVSFLMIKRVGSVPMKSSAIVFTHKKMINGQI